MTTLARLTTLRVGGSAARVVQAHDEQTLVESVREADRSGEPVLLVAGGSNLLVCDDGFEGTVVRVLTRSISASVDPCSGATVAVAAGHPWDEVVEYAVERGWTGIEALSGIPGATGSTPIQNVGAYGQEVSQVIARVRAWDRTEQAVRTLAASDCGFGYRHSRFKADPGRFVVLDVTFQLPLGNLGAPVAYAELARALGIGTGERAPLRHVRQTVLGLRAGKGMLLDADDRDTWSAGSFFTNPVLPQGFSLPEGAPSFPAQDGGVKTSAAWLIEQAGFGKGYGLPGPAALSTKHTLALTNRGTATAADLVDLARTVRDGVREHFGITLVNEPVLVGLTL